ncbi:cyclohexanone monooxygenase [Colletotrichum cereale]|nr:cyclohexanone monooxygenase [Colletotrichum cereale]
MNAYYIQKQMQNVEHVIYDKNEDLGGVWFENRYPGCACDVPSHAYTLPFALNPDWPSFYSSGSDIWAYLKKVCQVFDLAKCMRFNHRVIGCYWQQETGEWVVKIRHTLPDGSTHEFEDRCTVLLYGTGLLNNFRLPDIEGLDAFGGRVMHTADWPADYGAAHQWKPDRVAVIGSGASSVQVVPAMQPHVKHMHIFVRTGVWFVNIPAERGPEYEYTAAEKEGFKKDPAALVAYAKGIEDGLGSFFLLMFKGSTAQANSRKQIAERMASIITDERLLKGFTPTWSVGCKRPNPGDPYMRAIQEPNVSVHFTPAVKVTPTSIVGADGTTCEVDAIVCATGFDVSFRPRFPIVGQNGVDLAARWENCPEGYMGIAVPGFPNFFTFQGPNSPVQNGSSLGAMWHATQYVIQVMTKIQTENICSIMPQQDAANDFNAHCSEWARHTVWSEDCGGWYKHPQTGRLNSIWPGSSLHYMDTIGLPRYEDYDMTYLGPSKKNRFAYLGMGAARATVEKGDQSPYLAIDKIDPRWLKASGIDVEKVLEHKAEAAMKRWRREMQEIEQNVTAEMGNGGRV